MIWIVLLTKCKVVPLLEANEIVQPLELGAALGRAGDLCGDCHDGDVLARKVVV